MISPDGTPCQQSWAGERKSATIYRHILHECSYPNADIKSEVLKLQAKSSLVTRLEDLNTAVSSAGANGSQGTVSAIVKKQGRQIKNLAANNHLVNLICHAGCPPVLVDDLYFKKFVAELDPNVTIYHSSTFADTYIPKEADRITAEAIKTLSKLRNLTITYDGGTTRALDSIYTIHVTPPNTRNPHLLEGHSSSGVSHTAKHLSEVIVEKIIKPLNPQKSFSPERFAAICCDSTGNTRLCRELIQKEYPNIIVLGDICHHLSNTAKDIGKLEYFHSVSSNLSITPLSIIHKLLQTDYNPSPFCH
jgi:hypothetical protein